MRKRACSVEVIEVNVGYLPDQPTKPDSGTVERWGRWPAVPVSGHPRAVFFCQWCGVVPLTPHPTTLCNRWLSVTSPILTSHSMLNNCTILSRNLRKKKKTIKHNLFNFYCCSTCFQTTYSISPFLPPLFIWLSPSFIFEKIGKKYIIWVTWYVIKLH